MASQVGMIRTDYPGVYYRLAKRIGGKGTEKVFYISFKKDDKKVWEKAGREFADNMTPAKAATKRGLRIEGKIPSPKEKREKKKAEKLAESGKWTIQRLWDAYQEQRDITGSYKADLSRYNLYLQKPLGGKELKNLVPLDIDRIRINILKKKSAQTVKHILGIIKRLHHFSVNKGLAPGLSFAIQMPRVDNLKTEDLDPEQLSRLLEAIEQDKHPIAGAMMKCALFTGMRRGEMFKLKWVDVDFDRGFILIRSPKGGVSMSIPLNDSARELFLSLPRSSEFVFPGRGGRQRTDITKQLNEIKAAAGLPKDFRPLHGLRHVYASMLASSGEVDLYVLQRLLTHKSPQMTQRYAHLRDDALKRASDLAGDIIGQAINGKKKVVNIRKK